MKIAWNLFLLTAAVLLVFTVLYRWLEKWNWLDSFYNSCMITTTVGSPVEPKLNSTKLLMSAQALLTYSLIVQGVVQFI